MSKHDKSAIISKEQGEKRKFQPGITKIMRYGLQKQTINYTLQNYKLHSHM